MMRADGANAFETGCAIEFASAGAAGELDARCMILFGPTLDGVNAYMEFRGQIPLNLIGSLLFQEVYTEHAQGASQRLAPKDESVAAVGAGTF